MIRRGNDGNDGSDGGCGEDMMGSMISSRVGIVMDPRVPGQLVGSTETFGAAGKSTGVWLLARMSSDMSGLMFQPMKGFIA